MYVRGGKEIMNSRMMVMFVDLIVLGIALLLVVYYSGKLWGSDGRWFTLGVLILINWVLEDMRRK